jgi:hypothetical protein
MFDLFAIWMVLSDKKRTVEWPINYPQRFRPKVLPLSPKTIIFFA